MSGNWRSSFLTFNYGVYINICFICIFSNFSIGQYIQTFLTQQLPAAAMDLDNFCLICSMCGFQHGLWSKITLYHIYMYSIITIITQNFVWCTLSIQSFKFNFISQLVLIPPNTMNLVLYFQLDQFPFFCL